MNKGICLKKKDNQTKSNGILPELIFGSMRCLRKDFLFVIVNSNSSALMKFHLTR